MTADSVERVYPPEVMFKIVNPIMGWLLGTPAGRIVPALARLEFSGRRSGRRYRVVTAVHDIAGRPAVLTNSRWRVNFDGGHPVTVRRRGIPREMFGVLEDDPKKVAEVYANQIAALGVEAAPRRLGIAINGEGPPTIEQLSDLAKEVGLSVIYLDTAAAAS